MPEPQPIRIDLDAVLQSRLPRHYKYIPRFLVRWLENTICQDRLNAMLKECHGKRDADFCRGVIEHLNISYTTDGAGLPSGSRVIIACNHPLGGLDGMILIDYVTRVYGMKPKFIVNDLLMAIEPLSGVFLPINKHGQQSRQASSDIERAMESDAPVIIFPAGLVSRKGADGAIADLQWQKSFVNMAVRFQRDIIPTFFSGQNSKFFYNFAKLRTRLGLKFNVEMIRLPKEVFLSQGKNYTITVGEPIPWQSLANGSSARRQAEDIRNIVYNLSGK